MKNNTIFQRYINIEIIDKDKKNYSVLEKAIQQMTNNKYFTLEKHQYIITMINQRISKSFLDYLDKIEAQYLIISCRNRSNIITNKISNKKYLPLDEMKKIIQDHIIN